MKTYYAEEMDNDNPPPETEYMVVSQVDGRVEYLSRRTLTLVGNKALLHREDGPAIMYSDGYQEWRSYGALHRKDGPARIDPVDNTQDWYVMGKRVTSYAEYQRLSKCSDADIIFFKLKYGEITI